MFRIFLEMGNIYGNMVYIQAHDIPKSQLETFLIYL